MAHPTENIIIITSYVDAPFDMGELYSMNMGYSYNVGVDGYSTVYNSMPAYSPLSGI